MRAIKQLIDEFPSIKIDKVCRGPHYKVYLDTPAGKKILVVSVSASDRRAVMNNRSILRQWEKPNEYR